MKGISVREGFAFRIRLSGIRGSLERSENRDVKD